MRLPPEEFKKLYEETTELIKEYSKIYGENPKKVRSRKKNGMVPTIRRSVAKVLKCKYDLSTPNIGLLLCLDHSTVIGYLK